MAPPEKLGVTHTAVVTPGSHIENHRKKSLDEAFDFIRTHEATVVYDEAALKRLRRKIDWKVVPFLYLIFGIQYLDKYLMNYAIIMGLAKDLKLEGQDLNNCISALWISYLIAEAPISVILNKCPVAKWLGANVIVWGFLVTCTAAVNNYAGMLALRILLGIADASLPPSLMIISSQYYRKDEQATRFAWWFSAIGLGHILGGLISFGFQHVVHAALASWRIMYIVLGCISIVIGITSLIYLPDTPMTAWFLTDDEKAAILRHVAVNETGVHNSKFEPKQLVSLVADPQVWLLAFCCICASAGHGIIGNYSTTLIKSFGYDSKQAALLNTPGGAVGIVSIFAVAFLIRYNKIQRWAGITACKAVSVIGSGLLAFAKPKGARLAGIWIYSFALPAAGIVYQLTVANVAGHTKRSGAVATMSGATAIGHIIAPYAVQKKDAPEYRTARIVILGTQAGSAISICLLALYYLWQNRRRDRKYGKPLLNDTDSETVAEHDETWTNLTDGERKTFRYVY
ncbi:MFS general substrate transporter [Lecanosticta acicola]|uniref:MFS general substrate transporter n=1 Tax=Lecanosticta acicola TaxID=111012 RepID=A0AAI8YSK0_9PEZI|nr:MFS general substrate transporter [Lecanosticta acicola]